MDTKIIKKILYEKLDELFSFYKQNENNLELQKGGKLSRKKGRQREK